ncbi:MAG: S-layer homology domain-containing protein [Firmicutes bacterium]|nr:S-layer homology domain-containing protein [Bacillota bacterium]
MKTNRIVAIVLTVAFMLCCAAMPVAAAAPLFSDSDQTPWAEKSIERWESTNVLNGYGDGTFGPQNPMTRGEFSKVIAVILGLDQQVPAGTFDDLDKDAWYAQYINLCAEAKIISGYGDGKVNAEGYITRQEAFKMIVAAFHLPEAKDPAAAVKGFADKDEIGAWALGYVASIVESGAVVGEPMGDEMIVKPNDTITRAELVKILDRLIAVFVDAEGNVSLSTELANNAACNIIVVHADCEHDVKVELTEKGVVITVDGQEKAFTAEIQNGKTPVVVVKKAAMEVPKDGLFIDDKDADENENDATFHLVCEWEMTACDLCGKSCEAHKHAFTCTECGKTKTEDVAAVAHKEVVLAAKAATCTETGLTEGKKCSVCGTVTVAQKEIAALGHDFVEQTDCKVACEVTHDHVWDCSRCDVTKETQVDAKPHTFKDGVCTACGKTDSAAEKFFLEVKAGEGFVNGTVTDDYVATLVVSPAKVDPKNVTLTARMQNVGSLGVDSKREHSVNINTNISGDPELAVWLNNVWLFDKATVNVNVKDGEKTTAAAYELKGPALAKDAEIKDNAVITATPAGGKVEEMRTAWHAIVNDNTVKTYTQATDDSSIFIAGGSELRVLGDTLMFEGNECGLLLDNFNNLDAMEDTIRGTVKLEEGEMAAAEKYEVEAKLAAGTKLAVGSSVAVLQKDCVLKIDGLNAADMEGVLVALRDAESTYAMAEALVKMINNLVGSANNQTLTVDIEFFAPAADPAELTHEAIVECSGTCEVKHTDKNTCTVCGLVWEEEVEATHHNFVDGACTVCKKDYDDALKFGLTVESNAKVAATVTDDYNAILVVENGAVSAKQVTLTAVMQDVGSLGLGEGEVRSHSITVNTDMTAENVELKTWLSNAWGGVDSSADDEGFDKTTVAVDIEGEKCEYYVDGTVNAAGDAVIYAENASVEDTRAAWQKLTSYVSTETQDTDDSKVVIANGSYAILGGERLCFEKEVGDLTLDNFGDLSGLKQNIKDTVKVIDDENKGIELFVKAGTQLAVGSSVATLDKDCTITVTGAEVKDDVLSAVREAAQGSTTALVKELVTLINEMIGAVEGGTINVVIDFE